MSKKFLNSQISTRISVLLFLTLLFSMGAFTIFSIHDHIRQGKKILFENTTFLGKTIERILRVNMIERRYPGVQLAIDQFREDKDIKQMRLYNHSGKIVYATDSLAVGRKLNAGEYPCGFCHSKKNIDKKVLRESSEKVGFVEGNSTIDVLVPIRNSLSCSENPCHVHSTGKSILGLLTIRVSTASMMNELKLSQANIAILSLFIILIVTFLVYILLRYWLTLPVREIVKGTRRVASGNMDEPISPAPAEMGELASAFNRMQTRLKQSQQYLITCEKLASLGKMAAGVAHEINNPLTGILTFSESLLEEMPAGDVKRADVEVIRQQAIRSRDIVRKILDFARQDKLQIKYIQLNNLIERSIALVRRLTQFQNIQIVTRLDSRIPETLVDPGQIEQVVLNMLINSSEAIVSGGKIEVTTTLDTPGQEIIISIRDNGTGIEKENLTKIFDPFFSTKKENTQSNSGLGLSVSWGIIDQHGGRIEVDSEISQGTMFKIILPVRKEK